MLKNLRSFLAVFFSLLLCLSGMPTAALAEAMGEVTPTVAESTNPQAVLQAAVTVEWRTHASGDQPLAQDAAWHVFQPASSEETPSTSQSEPALDTIEARLTNNVAGLSYRVCDGTGTWQDAWVEGDTPLESANGIADVEFRRLLRPLVAHAHRGRPVV